MSYLGGIPGIGLDSIGAYGGLGSYGLGGSGTYGSYGDPTMMGMASPYAMGMMGMYNPTFMAQMNQMQQNMEKSQLQHSGDMHDMLLANQTRAFQVQDKNIFEKAMVDAAVNQGIENLSRKVKEGDQDGICEAFDTLKQTIYTKYHDYFEANASKISPSQSVTQFIEILYGKIRSQQEGQTVDLRSDIEKYGETAFEHGFMKSWRGGDYHQKYTDETMSYLFGTSIDNKSHKARMQKMGGKVESAVEYAAAPVLGAAAGWGAASVITGLGKTVTPEFVSKHVTWNTFKNCGKTMAWIGAAAALLGDIWWQNSRA